MRAEGTAPVSRTLVLVMNTSGILLIGPAYAKALDLQRRGFPDWTIVFWPLELWVASIYASRRVARAGWFNFGALIALLPLLTEVLIQTLEVQSMS